MINPSLKLKNKFLLVTGGAGFIGSHLCDRLLYCGAKVICFDNLSTGSRAYVDSLAEHKRFKFIRGDVNVLGDLKKVFEEYKIDYVFHYAALVGVQRTIENPLKVLADIEGIKNILELCRQHKVRKIVYASSSEVYGNQKKMPLNEEASYLDVRIPYAMVKSAGENYCRSYWEIMGLPITILRFFNVYGPRQESTRAGFVTGIFISQVLRGQRPTIFYDGVQTRDFMYVIDNIEASIQALINPKADGEIINLGTGQEMRILDLAKKIIGLSGKRLQPSLLHKRNLAEIKRRVADVVKMKKILGFTSKYSLDKGLRLTYEWYNAHPEFIKRGRELSFADYQKRVWRPQKEK